MEHLSLLELNTRIKKTLEKELSPSYWVVSEISELRLNPRGHCYIELVEKNDDQIIAKMKATIWSYTYSNLSLWFEKMTGQPLKSGMKILFNASVQYHEVFGLSLNIKDIDANYTIGERAIKRQQIVRQLEEDGILEMNKELELPLVPKNIAIISSKSAAGYGDFTNQLKNNPFKYSYNTRLFQASMQGDTAPESIISALHEIHDSTYRFDLVLLIRGGGSQLDLDCFDNYELNSHLAQFPIPVITGIGHERDETIADLVAHTSLKTPTAVAEFLITGVRNFEEELDIHLQRIINQSAEITEYEQSNLRQLTLQLANGTQSKISVQNNTIAILEQKLQFASKYYINNQENKLNELESVLKLLSPETILKRGFTLTSINNKMLKEDPTPGDVLVTETYTSKITSTVNNINTK
ncbi:MAG: exodeoxyribonuclease VII large subunit [Cyclobacteriaceae bacterium]|nr:exodeoxyribonuclease VII large subunit [Cyclobacteriaceae bacterium]